MSSNFMPQPLRWGLALFFACPSDSPSLSLFHVIGGFAIAILWLTLTSRRLRKHFNID